MSSPFHPALDYFANYTSFSFKFFSQVFHSPSLHFPYSLLTILLIQLFSHTVLVVYVDVVPSELTSPSHTYYTSWHHTGITLPPPSTFLHAFAPDCILRRTSIPTRPFSDICPPRYTRVFTWLMSFQPAV